MKVRELRTILQSHTSLKDKFFNLISSERRQIMAYVKSLDNKLDEDDLDGNDLFRLFMILSKDIKSPLAMDLKKVSNLVIKLNKNELLEFIEILNLLPTEYITEQLLSNLKFSENYKDYFKIIKFLFKNHDLKIDSKNLIKLFNMQLEMSPDCVLNLFSAFEEMKLLSAPIINHILEQPKIKMFIILYLITELNNIKIRLSDENFLRITNNDFDLQNFNEITNILIDMKLATNENINLIIELSNNNLKFLLDLMNKLPRKSLDFKNFNKLFNIVVKKLPEVAPSAVDKERRLDTGQKNSNMTIDNKHNLFFESNPYYLRGGCGKIKKAFIEKEDHITHAVKISTESDQQFIKREAKVNRFLFNRTAFWFERNKKTYLVTEWINGENLKNIAKTPVVLLKMSQNIRMQMLISALKDLEILHSEFRVHGDIKPDNFILDEKNSLRLIDFGSIRKAGKQYNKIFPFTPSYHEISVVFDNFEFKHDMYAFAYIIATLFPEYFNIDLSLINSTIKFTSQSKTSYSEALTNLVNNLQNPDSNLRTTCCDALMYCQKIFEHYDKLQLEMVDQFTNEYLYKKELTDVDALRGRANRR